MRGNHYDKKIKIQAKKMRANGKTYQEIKTALKIPKSTLSNWLSREFVGSFSRKDQLTHLAKIRPAALAVLKKKRDDLDTLLRKKIMQEIKTYPIKNIGFLKSLLAVLYWAEGAKHRGVSGLQFTNTDPDLSRFFITLLRKCYKLNESRFRIRLHLHYYHKIVESKKFWSKLLKIPLSQFTSTYIKKRSRKKRFRKNFMGICLMRYLDSNIRKDIMELNHQLLLFCTK